MEEGWPASGKGSEGGERKLHSHERQQRSHEDYVQGLRVRIERVGNGLAAGMLSSKTIYVNDRQIEGKSCLCDLQRLGCKNVDDSQRMQVKGRLKGTGYE